MSDKPLCCQHSEILVGKSGKVSFGFGCAPKGENHRRRRLFDYLRRI